MENRGKGSLVGAVGLLPSLVLLGLVGGGCSEVSTDDTDYDAVVWTCPDHTNCEEDYCDRTLIPAGEFTMGGEHAPHEDSYWPSGDERPVHTVNLDAFCIDTYEVSLDRYESCVDKDECSPGGGEWEDTTGANAVDTWVNHYPSTCYTFSYQIKQECVDRAVNAKSYYQAEAYCEWIGASLCTEAQWERAANGPGPEQRLHPWGDEDPNSELVNLPSTNGYSTGGEGYVESVDSFHAGASHEGVLNMAGNVYEWVQDGYALYEKGPNGEALDNPSYPAEEGDDGVGRGSCFFTEPEHTVSERSVFPLDFDWG